ncbi:MAG: Hpt domain-containing protein, partial [Pseudanabaena sp.]
EILETFCESISEKLIKLENAIADSDFQELEKIAHFIKGSSSNIGISSIAEIAYKLEQIGRKQQLDEAINLFNRMQDLFSQIQKISLNYGCYVEVSKTHTPRPSPIKGEGNKKLV